MKIIKQQNLILILILIAVAFGIYVNSLHGDFLIDDQALINNERLQDLKVYFTEHFGIYTSVLWDVRHAVILHFSKGSPFLFHLFNVLAHVSCVVLLFVLCNVLFKDRALSFLSSLIFAIHPIHTEAISWISGGHYAFSSLFFIASFIFYIKSDKSIFNLALSVVFFALCAFSGLSVAVLPIMFILFDLFIREKDVQNMQLRKFRIGILFLIFVISAIFIGMLFVKRNQFIHLIFYFRGYKYLIVAAKAFIYYLKILYMPIERGLYHPFAFNTTEIQRVSPALFFSLAVIISSIVAFFKCRRNLKPVSFGIMWFFITFLPYSNIIPVCNIISERYLYLPSVGFSIILAYLFLKVWEIINRSTQLKKALRILSISALSLFLCSYVFLTIKRNYEYNNIITYWESNINNFPDGYMVYNNLAGTFYASGNLENAMYYSRINLMVNPNQPHVWCNLGKVYREMGNVEEAKNCYQEALNIDKNYFPAHKALKEIEAQAIE